MTNASSAVVKQLPENLTVKQARQLFREMEPLLATNRPWIVFDFSQVRVLDSAGVEVLMRCVEDVLKRNGDLKLAAIPPEPAVILELTGVDRFFEVFDSTTDAVESFERFPMHAFQQGSVSLDSEDGFGRVNQAQEVKVAG